MGWSGVLAGIGAGLAGAISNAVSNSNNKKPSSSTSSGSTSSGSSSNSSGSSNSSQSSSRPSGGSSGGNYQYGNFINDSGTQTISQEDYNKWQAGADQASKDWNLTDDPVKKQELHDKAIYYNTLLGKSYDDKTGTWHGGYAIKNPYDDAMEQYNKYMQEAAEQQQAAIQAGVDSAVAGLNAQKGTLAQQIAASNAAAEKAYMQTIKPGGSLAENLAANGLLSSGLTESSQIQAGNAYQGALNSNAQAETDALKEIELAINQAQLTGDLDKAQGIAQYLQNVANQAYQNVNNIAQWNQWKTENSQNNSYQQAMLEMQKQELALQLKMGQITYEQYAKQNALLDQQIEAARLQNQYYKSQL